MLSTAMPILPSTEVGLYVSLALALIIAALVQTRAHTRTGVWYHGDFIWINPNTKGVVMLGRSDGTLKPAGVRFGSAELYNIGMRVLDASDD